jgi:hypothetical protein
MWHHVCSHHNLFHSLHHGWKQKRKTQARSEY